MRSSVRSAPPPVDQIAQQRADKYSRWPGTWLIREENDGKIVSQHAAHARDALGAAPPFRAIRVVSTAQERQEGIAPDCVLPSTTNLSRNCTTEIYSILDCVAVNLSKVALRMKRHYAG
jgi:hypothetical protein